MPKYTVIFKPSADKQRRKLPRDVQVRIVRAVEELAEEPRPSGALKLAAEEDIWRIRVGDYRVIYEIEDKQLMVLVLRVAHRKDVYRGL